MPPRSKTMRNMSVMPSQTESRPAMPHQPNQAKGANGVRVGPQQQRNPVDNTNFFTDVFDIKYFIPQLNGFVDVFVKRVATRDFIKRIGGRISIKLVEEGEARDSQIVFFFLSL